MKKTFVLLLSFIFIKNSFSQSWEANFLHNLNPSQTHPQGWVTITNSVYPLSLATPVTIIGIGLLNKDKKLQKQGFKIVGSLLINTTITQGLKYSLNRNRPYVDYPNLIKPYNIENDASFPSGHTSTAFSLATSVSLQFKKWYIVVPSFLWAGSVGYSRMHLGEHYPTDVFAGALIGVGSTYLSDYLTKKLLK